MASEKDLQKIVTAIRQFCEKNADPKISDKYKKFFTEGYDAYGVNKDIFKAETARIKEEQKNKLSLADHIQLGNLLIQSGKYEEASFAIRLLDPFHDKFKKTHFQQIGAWLENGIRNWGHTDVLCSDILTIFLDQGIIELKELSNWRKSSSKWKRRAVPVLMINSAKNAKTDSDIEPFLDFIRPLMHDEDRFVHQGLGWFLREAWKKCPEPVEELLFEFKDTAPRKIYQYATEKMNKEQKERFRALKKKKD